MTKKEKILKIFNNAVWIDSLSGAKTKIITYTDFRDAGLSPTTEVGEKYNDVIYARQLLNKMGYKVLIGIGFHVFSKPKAVK